MARRTQRQTDILTRLVMNAERCDRLGEVCEYALKTERDAVNLRQRLYSFKKSLLLNTPGEPGALLDNLRRLSVSVKGTTVILELKDEDFLDAL